MMLHRDFLRLALVLSIALVSGDSPTLSRVGRVKFVTNAHTGDACKSEGPYTRCWSQTGNLISTSRRNGNLTIIWMPDGRRILTQTRPDGTTQTLKETQPDISWEPCPFHPGRPEPCDVPDALDTPPPR
jgi:hypothetical protein